MICILLIASRIGWRMKKIIHGLYPDNNPNESTCLYEEETEHYQQTLLNQNACDLQSPAVSEKFVVLDETQASQKEVILIERSPHPPLEKKMVSRKMVQMTAQSHNFKRKIETEIRTKNKAKPSRQKNSLKNTLSQKKNIVVAHFFRNIHIALRKMISTRKSGASVQHKEIYRALLAMDEKIFNEHTFILLIFTNILIDLRDLSPFCHKMTNL